MASARIWVTKLMIAAALGGVTANAGRTQQTTSPPQVPNSLTAPTDVKDPFGSKQEQIDNKDRGVVPVRLQEMQQTERQKRLVADSDRLLQLATQLHTDVAKTNKNVLSVDVIKRADEIEKLAHSVKEHMKG